MSRAEVETELLKNSKRYDSIDGLRAFSAIGIVLMHVLANGNYSLDGFAFDRLIPSFTNLVFLFMIISAFSMCCGYYDRIINNEITVGEFYGKRYAKVWPFFALLCVLDLIASPSVNSLYEVFANLTLCFGLLPNAKISVIGVGWFLGLVFVFYLIFPFFCYMISDKRRAWFSFVVALMFNLFCADYFGIERTNFMYSAVFFLVGGLIFIYRGQLEKVVEKYRWIVLGLCAVTTVGYYVLGGTIVLMLILFSLYLIYALGNNKRGMLRNSITMFFSSISMEVYLTHMLIYRVLEKVGITHILGDGILAYTFIFMGTLVGTVGFAIITQKGIKLIDKLVFFMRKRVNERKHLEQ